MIGWKNVVYNVSLALNFLLAFLLFFNDQLVVPGWLQIGGRVHPVILHFPIVIIALYVLWLFTAQQNSHYVQIARDLLLLSSVTAVTTALSGLLLSKESGYDPDAVEAHKWMGAITSFLLLFWYWISSFKTLHRGYNFVASFILLLVVLFAGDLGGNITHGEDFLAAAISTENKKPPVAFEDAFVYADLVEPILQSKCVSCHNNKKAKGQLIMETKELLAKGGKSGKLWDTTSADLGLLMRRIHLLEEEKEHMPPVGKPQLTSEEMTILFAWVKSGAAMDNKIIDLARNDTLRTIASKRLQQSAEQQYSFETADEKKVKQLNNTNRFIYPVAVNSPALVVNFYNSSFFNSQQLQELEEIRPQIVELNLSKMPVKDEDLKIIAGFYNLHTLNLNYTSITGSTLRELKKLPQLKSLSLTGTSLNQKHVEILQSFPKLKSVFIWKSGIAAADVAQINKQGRIHFETGFNGDTIMLKLTPPVILNNENAVTKDPVRLKHYINGTVLRYTTDGTEPDSTTSAVYKNELPLQKGFMLKARAVKNGWYSSDVVQRYFLASTYSPDSVSLLQPADVKYSAKGNRTLIDLVKSDVSRGTGKWLGYRDNNFAAMLSFNKTITATSVTLSMLKDVSGYIFPPTSVEIWGGVDQGKMRLLGKVSPKMPVKIDQNENLAITGNFAATPVKFIKIIAKPISKLPGWHPGKGEKGWIFIDELFVN